MSSGATGLRNMCSHFDIGINDDFVTVAYGEKQNRKQNKKPDMTMLALVLLLVAFGLVMLFSTSEYNGRVRFGDSACYFKEQLFATALGLFGNVSGSRLDYRLLVRWPRRPICCLSVVHSSAVFRTGDQWIEEVAESGAAFLSAVGACQGGGDPFFLPGRSKSTTKHSNSLWFMCRTMLTLLPIVGLVGSNNLSTAIIILGIGVVLIFVSNPRYLPFVGVGTVGIGVVAVFLAAESYRLERLAIWRNPRPTKKASRPFRGSMPLEAADFLAGGLAAACRSLDLSRKHRTI